MKQQAMEKKIFAKYISDKGFVPKIYKELLQLNKTTHGGVGVGNEQKILIKTLSQRIEVEN